jgi:UDP-glucose 4-epimerase
MTILVTGGAGYIGSHTCVELLEQGYRVVVVDNLANSRQESIARIQQVSGKACQFHQVDLRDRARLLEVFESEQVEAVLHFAGSKAVGESVKMPLAYFDNNLMGSIVLFEVMQHCGVKRLVFSSSATVYGSPDHVPINEEAPLGVTNPYGRTKLMIEEMLTDVAVAEPEWSITLLRYFNPVGAHPSGNMGEDPAGIPNNLFPYIAQVAVGRLPQLSIFGNDYPTSDGTCIRDYIHVVDLAQGHLAALARLGDTPGIRAINLGSGQGVSVLEAVAAFERASGKKIPYHFAPRRAGDAVATFADPTKAKRLLDWQTQRSLDDMCADTWHWQTLNPRGYEDNT